jgi:hypothetical protein
MNKFPVFLFIFNKFDLQVAIGLVIIRQESIFMNNILHIITKAQD